MEDHILFWQVKLLKQGDILYAIDYYERDGSPQEYKVITKPRTFERNKLRVEVLLQRGQEKIWLTDECVEEFTQFHPKNIPRRNRNI